MQLRKISIRLTLLCIVLIVLSCSKSIETEPESEVEAQLPCYVYRDCIDEYEGRYCTNGNKFGEDKQFNNFGVDRPGPSSDGQIVRYSFQSPGMTYEASIHGAFESKPFSDISSFAKESIRAALKEYESHINITFEETADEEGSDLKLICADIEDKAGIGFSECTDNLCIEMKGFIFFKNKFLLKEYFYSLALHEIGHALGLCHSNPDNIMSHNSSVYSFNSLQAGDIEGIKSIYGAK